MFKSILFSVALAVSAGGAHAATYASSALRTNTTDFGSGILTGAPDGGGTFLGSSFDPPAILGSIVFGFDVELFDGAGADFQLFEVASSANEIFDISLSNDGSLFTSLGIFNATQSLIDVGGAFAGGFSFIRLTNASTLVSADFDAVEALNFRDAAVVPLPASVPLLLASLGMLGLVGRRKRSI